MAQEPKFDVTRTYDANQDANTDLDSSHLSKSNLDTSQLTETTSDIVMVDDQKANQEDEATEKKDETTGSTNQNQSEQTWEWQENDRTWHSYDEKTQELLHNLQVNSKLSVKFGSYTYEILKTGSDTAVQVNTTTKVKRDVKRTVVDVGSLLTSLPQQKTLCFQWQFLENDNLWYNVSPQISQQIETLAVSAQGQYTFGKWTYDVDKISQDTCTQTNCSTGAMRDLRRILWDSLNNHRISCEYLNDNHKWQASDSCELAKTLALLPPKSKSVFKHGKWTYNISKSLDGKSGTQQNTNSGRVRQLRMSTDDGKTPDPYWQSNVNAPQAVPASGGPAGIVTAYQQQVQAKLQQISQSQNEAEIDLNEEYAVDVDLMNDTNAQNALQMFQKTMKNNKYKIKKMKKVKENLSNIAVYNAVLQTRKENKTGDQGEEEKESSDDEDEKQNSVEMMLFHGTTHNNAAKVIKNGFNRDFNVVHMYGRGTYFTTTAKKANKYCTERKDGELIMLVCSVLVGDYCVGDSQMVHPPVKEDGVSQFDCLVDDQANPTIFVISRDYHAVPVFVILYEKIQPTEKKNT